VVRRARSPLLRGVSAAVSQAEPRDLELETLRRNFELPRRALDVAVVLIERGRDLGPA